MRLSGLRLQNFRNYEELELCFDPQMNVIIGENAQGKSNILEAISYLGLTFSFRDAEDKEMISWGKNNFFIEGEISSRAGEKTLTAAYSIEKRKLWTIDGVQKHRLNDIFGNFYAVTFSPEDMALIKRGPEIKRRFLNREMMQLYPGFCVLLNRYNKVLKQRNALLKDDFADSAIAPWTEQLCALAAEISLQRYAYIKSLQPFFQAAQLELSENSEQAELEYLGFFTKEQLEEADREKMSEKLKEYFLQNAGQERARKTTIAGIQRDDMGFLLNGREAKAFASQGQQRSLVLSLKLAQLQHAEAILGEPPVLLLDDVLSELDPARASRILQLMSAHAQTFITGTQAELNSENGKFFEVRAGTVREK